MSKAQELIKKEGLLGMIVTDPYNMRHISGFRGGEGALYISATQQVLITDSRYTEQAEKESDFTIVQEHRGHTREQIFAECIGADWKPSNVGLDDVILENCCWGAKTVFSSSNIEKQSTVRLISGRNSPTYSYGVDSVMSDDPNLIGKMVLDIWN